MATANETATGILLPCPCCGENEAGISLRLEDKSFQCSACDGEFTLDCIKAIMARWQKIVQWVDSMPTD